MISIRNLSPEAILNNDYSGEYITIMHLILDKIKRRLCGGVAGI